MLMRQVVSPAADEITILQSILYNYKSKKDSKDQESIQSSTTPVPGYQIQHVRKNIFQHSTF